MEHLYHRWGYNVEREVADAQLEAKLASGSVTELASIVRKQQAVIRDLGVAVSVLTEMLAEAGTINAESFLARMDAGITDQQNAPETVMCSSCHKEVLKARTDIRDRGPVCDACVAKGL